MQSGGEPAKPLTRAEVEALKALVEAGTAKMAARQLGRAEGTVKKQLESVRTKLECVSLPQATARAAQLRYLSFDELSIARFGGSPLADDPPD